MKRMCAMVTWIVILAGTFLLCRESKGYVTGLLYAPVVFAPLFLHFYLSQIWKSRLSDWVLALTSFLFGIWFIYRFRTVFIWHPESEGPGALLFTGLKALPALAVGWLLAFVLRNKSRP